MDNKSKLMKIIIALLIVIIIILIYNTNIIYKFTVITDKNIEEILMTSKLSKEEKATITYKYFLNPKSVINKTILEALK